MIFDSMASPSPNQYNGKTDQASWNFARKKSKRDEPACRSTRTESIRSKQCREHTPRVMVDALNFRAALLVTFLPNNGDE